MSAKVRFAFLLDKATIPIESIIPTKTVSEERKATNVYKKIVASMKAIGLAEPPVVTRDRRSKTYILLDGHVRVSVLKEMGVKEVTCLVATDDEAFTYDEHVSHIAPIQANRMIVRAIANGVPEATIAQALDISIHTVRDSHSLTEGICPEAIEILKDKPIGREALLYIKRVKPLRQIAMAELMDTSKVFSASYANALFVATPPQDRLRAERKDASAKLSDAELARMQNEQRALERDYLLLSESYGENTMQLQLACQYLKKIFSSAKVVKYLSTHHVDAYAALTKVLEASDLDA